MKNIHDSRNRLFFTVFFFQFAFTAFSSSYYWVGGSGAWSDFSTHWATTSGGTVFHSQEPTLADNVYFDANSFTANGEEVNFLNDTVYCRDMVWTGALFNPFFNAPSGLLHVGGSMILTDSIVIQYPFAVSFEATTPGQVIYSSYYLVYATFDGPGGSWTMLSNLNCGDLTVTQGDFISNNKLLFVSGGMAGNFVSNSGLPRSISFGTSEIYVEGNWDLSSSGLSLFADSCNITMQNGLNVVFEGADQLYHDLNFLNPNAIVNGNNSFGKVVTYDNITFTGNNSFDSLMIANQINPILFQSGSTQTINLLMETNSAPSQIINIRSTIPGQQSTIFLPIGHTICLNYVNLTDQNAIGGGNFFAGSSSVNTSNNSGWQFIDCSPALSSVWPGDANHDLIVDNFDLLTIAADYDAFGFIRPAASNNFIAQPCIDWFYEDINHVNYKYADSDGDMIINESDTVAILQNYMQTHPARLTDPHEPVITSGPGLFFQIPTTVAPGSTISVPVFLGTSALQAMNVYGIAFTVNYDTTQIVPGSVSSDYSGSWLVSPGNNIHIEKSFPSNGQFDLGFARIDHQNISGNGMIVTLNFGIRNNIPAGFCLLQLTHVRLISASGIEVPVSPVNSSLFVGVNELSNPLDASVYPNPANEWVNISVLKNPGNLTFISVADIAGKIINEGEFTDVQSKIDFSGITPGIYFITVSDERGKSVFKVVRN